MPIPARAYMPSSTGLERLPERPPGRRGHWMASFESKYTCPLANETPGETVTRSHGVTSTDARTGKLSVAPSPVCFGVSLSTVYT